MAKSKNTKEIDQGKLIITASIIVGLVMSVISVLMKNYSGIFLVLLTAIVTSQVVKLCNNIVVKRTADRFSIDLDVIKQGDYSKFVDSKSFGVLAGIASIINAVLRYQGFNRRLFYIITLHYTSLQKGRHNGS